MQSALLFRRPKESPEVDCCPVQDNRDRRYRYNMLTRHKVVQLGLQATQQDAMAAEARRDSEAQVAMREALYKMRHFFFLPASFRVVRAARVACSNTSRTPSFVFAEHSRYFWAPIFLRTSSACAKLASLF